MFSESKKLNEIKESSAYLCDDHSLPANVKDRLDVGKKPTDEQTKEIAKSKKFLGTDKNGVNIFSIDGEFIRQYIYEDFTQGGNDYAYPNFVPKNELWVDKDVVNETRKTTIAHESKEREEMAKGKFYDKGKNSAHDKALKYEKKIREK
jgi:hypothetical protein